MPTLEELEALSQGSESPQPGVQAPVPVQQPPTMAELEKLANPALDTSLDKPADVAPALYPWDLGGFSDNKVPTWEERRRNLGEALGSVGRKAVVEPLRGFANVGLSLAEFPFATADAIANSVEDYIPDSIEGGYLQKGGLKALEATRSLINPSGPDDRNWLEKTPEALGSAAAFLVGGVAAAPETLLGRSLTAGGLGATTGATDQYNEAVAMGADPEQALLAYGGGALFGSTEAIPGELFLRKLNQLGGGKILEQIMHKGTGADGNVFLEALKGGAEEMVQEGVQAAGTNWVASDLAGYDPTRSWGENFWDNVLSGGVVGSLLGGGIQLARRGEVAEVRRGLEEEYKRRLNSGDAINALAVPGNGFGSFSPVEDLIALNKMKADLDRHIDRKAEHELRQLERRSADLHESIFNNQVDIDEAGDAFGTSPFEGTHWTVPEYKGEEEEGRWLTNNLDQQVNRFAEGIGAKENPPSVREKLRTERVVAQGSKYDDLLADAKGILAGYERLAAEVNDPKNPINDPNSPIAKEFPVDRKALNIKLGILRARVEAISKKVGYANFLMKTMKEAITNWGEVYNPDMKYVVRDYDSHREEGEDTEGTQGRNIGWFASTDKVDLGDGKPTKVGVMYFNTERLVDEMYKQGMLNNTPDFRAARRAVYEVINHELGHSVMTNHLRQTLNTAESDTATPEEKRKAYKAFVLLQKEYQEWLMEMANSSQKDFFTSSFAQDRGGMFLRRHADALREAGQNPSDARMNEPLPPQFPPKSYLLSFDEFFAEMTARLATAGHLNTPELTQFFEPVVKEYENMGKKMPDFFTTMNATNWKEFLQSKALSFRVQKAIKEAQKAKKLNLWDALQKKIPGLNPENFAGFRQDLDTWNFFTKYGLSLWQLAEVNKHIPQFQTYLQTTEKMNQYIRSFGQKATEILEDLRALGKQEHANLSKVLYDESEAGILYSPKQLSNSLTGEGLKAYQKIRTELNRVLSEMKRVTLLQANRASRGNSEKLKASVEEIEKEFAAMQNSGYFPYVRFGNYTLTIRANEDLTMYGRDFKAGELVTFQAFESKEEREMHAKKLRGILGSKANVGEGKMREADHVIQGMPRTMLLAIRDSLDANGALTKETEEAIEKALAANAPFKSFRNHFKKRQGIHGYSEDMQRTFAHYIKMAASSIAKTEYAGELNDSVASLQNVTNVIIGLGEDATQRQEMVDWLKRHYDYIMNPGNEWAAIRSIGFVAYLGMNIKSAFTQTMQLMVNAPAHLGARYGDVKAYAELTKATNTLRDYHFGHAKYAAAPEGSKENRILRLIAQGKSEGWLDQSYATELAIAATENNLDRSLYLPSGKRFFHAIARYSSLPFHIMEKSNRYITSIAAYNLEFAESQSHEKAVMAAKLANRSINFENERWARAPFLRGKASAALLFQSFVQNQLYFVARNPGSSRFLVSMLLLAGVMGLPGADDLADLLEAAITKLNKELGMKNPKVQLRTEMRDMLNDLGANPDLVLHGLSQDSFGLGQVGELTGIPIPHFDLSASVGMGNLIPFTDIPSRVMGGSDAGETLLQTASEAGGASGNLVEDYYRSLFSKEPNDWKRIERLLPMMSMRNLSKAARYAVQQKEQMANGVVVANFTPYDIRNGLEIFGQALGFPITKVNQGWEREFAKADMVNFYKTYQQGIQRQMNIAYMQEDREAIADAREAYQVYNSQVPYPEMKIKPADAREAVRAYIVTQMKAEAGVAGQAKYRRLLKSVSEEYPDPYSDIASKDVDFRP